MAAACGSKNFYPRPPRGGRPTSTEHLEAMLKISIHALREEGDLESSSVPRIAANFYPRPPRGGRPERALSGVLWFRFLSTPSARRATKYLGEASDDYEISIHALREEGDKTTVAAASPPTNFYPRPPRGGRRRCDVVDLQVLEISIHALREEGDTARPPRRPTPSNFYPRPPRGGRPSTSHLSLLLMIFLSTPSARRATIKNGYAIDDDKFLSTPSARRATIPINIADVQDAQISIHALREEGDLEDVKDIQRVCDFYPRPPRGGRLRSKERALMVYSISIHALREEGDHVPFVHHLGNKLFLSTPSARRATAV